MSKDKDAFRTIGEVSEALALPQHVIRFWEARFSQLSPLKRGGNRRYYRPNDVALLAAIKGLLYDDGYTIKGVQRLLKSKGVRGVSVAVLDSGLVSADSTGDAGEPEVLPQAHQPAETEVSSSSSASRADQIAALAAEIDACARRLEAARNAAA